MHGKKNVVIIGGTSGIGLAAAKKLAKTPLCARVFIASRKEPSETFGHHYMHVDVEDEKSIDELFFRISEECGTLDALIYSAGRPGSSKPVLEIELEDIKKLFSVHTLGALKCVQRATPLMSNGGAIVLLGSVAQQIGFPGYVGYAISKSPLEIMTKTLAIELSPLHISINCIAPGTIDTPINNNPEGQLEVAAMQILCPQQRIGRAEEVATLIEFLALNECRYLTGQTIALDGGVSVGISLGMFECVQRAFTQLHVAQ